jgi:hypothetical protein
MSNSRWEKHRKDFERGAVKGSGAKTSAQAREKLGEALMQRAKDPEASNAVAAAEKVAEFSGWIPKDKREEADQPGTVRLSLTGTVQAVRKALMAKYARDDEEEGEDVPKAKPHLPDLGVIEGRFKPSEE